jgi:hypothetical protein
VRGTCALIFLIGCIAGVTSWAAFDEKGAPGRVQCKVATYTANSDITEKRDIEWLLAHSQYLKVLQTVKTCPKNEGKVVTCELPYETDALKFRYYFNTQGGGLTLEDTESGQSSDVEWTNQYNLTESGYLNVSGELTNVRGGLLGQNRIFRVEVTCYASARDWRK